MNTKKPIQFAMQMEHQQFYESNCSLPELVANRQRPFWALRLAEFTNFGNGEPFKSGSGDIFITNDMCMIRKFRKETYTFK